MSCGRMWSIQGNDFHGISIHAALDSNPATLGDVCRGLSWPIFWPWGFVSSSWMAMSLVMMQKIGYLNYSDTTERPELFFEFNKIQNDVH